MIKANRERAEPPPYFVEDYGDTLRIVVTDPDSVIVEESPEGQNEYTYHQYEMLIQALDLDVEKEIQSNFGAWLSKAKEVDRDRTETILRRRRDDLLRKSDCEMSLDRIGLEIPTGSTITAWLSFLRKMGEALVGEWAVYRQKLRDLPQSDKWPYLDDDDWPTEPRTKAN